MKKTALRTDDTRFAHLPGYPYAAHYLYVHHPDYEPLRMHYLDIERLDINRPDEGSIDEGSIDKAAAEIFTILLLHGCPTWSYLYRKVIAALLENGAGGPAIRIIAPDFIGCGKSDKLLSRADYSYDFHVDTLEQLITQLNLEKIVLVCQDWGGPIGLRACSEMPKRIAAIIASNTLLPNCEPAPRGTAHWPGATIANWVRYTQQAGDMSISQIVQGVTESTLSADILAAYDAPFPDASYKQGMLGWPSLIPLNENAAGIRENRKTWQFLETSATPFITAFSDKDPSTADWEIVFQRRVKGAKNQCHQRIEHAGHMVQEDRGDTLAAIIKNLLDTAAFATGPGCNPATDPN